MKHPPEDGDGIDPEPVGMDRRVSPRECRTNPEPTPEDALASVHARSLRVREHGRRVATEEAARWAHVHALQRREEALHGRRASLVALLRSLRKRARKRT